MSCIGNSGHQISQDCVLFLEGIVSVHKKPLQQEKFLRKCLKRKSVADRKVPLEMEVGSYLKQVPPDQNRTVAPLVQFQFRVSLRKSFEDILIYGHSFRMVLCELSTLPVISQTTPLAKIYSARLKTYELDSVLIPITIFFVFVFFASTVSLFL